MTVMQFKFTLVIRGNGCNCICNVLGRKQVLLHCEISMFLFLFPLPFPFSFPSLFLFLFSLLLLSSPCDCGACVACFHGGRHSVWVADIVRVGSQATVRPNRLGL